MLEKRSQNWIAEERKAFPLHAADPVWPLAPRMVLLSTVKGHPWTQSREQTLSTVGYSPNTAPLLHTHKGREEDRERGREGGEERGGKERERERRRKINELPTYFLILFLGHTSSTPSWALRGYFWQIWGMLGIKPRSATCKGATSTFTTVLSL